MNRPIKFRGKRSDNGEFVYGDFGRADNTGEPVIYFIDDERNWVGATVGEDSVAQLVEFDANGNEVYEGDKVVSEYGDEIVARLMDNLPPKAKLKEATK